MKKHIINTSIILAISVFITFLFAGFTTSLQSILLNIAYGVLIGLSIAIGSSFISKKMYSIGDWHLNPINKYVSVIIAISTYIIIDVAIVNIIWFKITQNIGFTELISSNFFLWIILTELVTGIIIYLIILSANFSKRLNEFHLQATKAQEDINKYKLSTLRNQVNPHFLFNSLNVLSSLIYSDTEKADDFISKLASIYRYVLDVQDTEAIPIEQELEFINNYLELQSIRFGNNIVSEIDVRSDKLIIPMALQILVENAIKHNMVSDDKKLKIIIKNTTDYLIVSNNINPKSETENSHELGLKNIISRYKFLTDAKVELNNNSNIFEVKLPLLKLKS